MKFGKILLATFIGSLLCGVVMLFLWIISIVSLVTSASLKTIEPIESDSVLEITLSQVLQDSPLVNPFSSINFSTFEMNEQITLLSALGAIEAAATDDNIEGIYLHIDKLATLTSSNIEELRTALLEFKKSGKFIIAYNDIYMQGSYYLCTVADKIYIQPEGMLMWQGMASNVTFYKGLLDKLDVKMEVFRPTVCKYKSAVEPYILEKMSPANRLQMQELLNSMWSVIAEDVAAARNLTVEQVNDFADQISCREPAEALDCGMVDGVIYEDELLPIFEELGVEVDDDKARSVELGDYIAQRGVNLAKYGSDKVGIIYAEGEIVDGEGSDPKVYGDMLAATVKKARLDDSVKSVVLRVNSPGGSALASDVMWRELELLRAEKPLIVSMGGMAASGGYYISAPADVIIADRLTLTGSIGVFGMAPNIEGALASKLGVTSDKVVTNKNADFMTSLGGMTPYQRALMVKSVDKVYSRFTSLVSEGRNLPLERVLEIAQGRVWSGEMAKEIGLVDEIGGLKVAIAVAVEKAGLDAENFRVVEILGEPTGINALFATAQAQITARFAKMQTSSALDMIYNDYAEIRSALEPLLSRDGMVMYCPYKIEF